MAPTPPTTPAPPASTPRRARLAHEADCRKAAAPPGEMQGRVAPGPRAAGIAGVFPAKWDPERPVDPACANQYGRRRRASSFAVAFAVTSGGPLVPCRRRSVVARRAARAR